MSAKKKRIKTTYSTTVAASCSFCGRNNTQVALIMRAGDVAICDGCIALAVDTTFCHLRRVQAEWNKCQHPEQSGKGER